VKRAAAMLMAQAYTLDAIFNHLAQRAVNPAMGYVRQANIAHGP